MNLLADPIVSEKEDIRFSSSHVAKINYGYCSFEYIETSHFFGCTFHDCDMEGLSIVSSIFENCSFTDCDFTRAGFYGCKFTNCTFKNCNMEKFKISECEGHACIDFKMSGCNIYLADFDDKVVSCIDDAFDGQYAYYNINKDVVNVEVDKQILAFSSDAFYASAKDSNQLRHHCHIYAANYFKGHREHWKELQGLD